MSSFDVVNGTFEGWKTQPNDGELFSIVLFEHSNLIASFKHCLWAWDYIDNILLLKSTSLYDYIQNGCFLGQSCRQNVCFVQDIYSCNCKWGGFSEVDACWWQSPKFLGLWVEIP